MAGRVEMYVFYFIVVVFVILTKHNTNINICKNNYFQVCVHVCLYICNTHRESESLLCMVSNVLSMVIIIE